MRILTVLIVKLSCGSNFVMKAISAPLFASYLVLIFISVISRFVLKTPIVEAIELSRLGFVWSCLAGATIAYKRSQHICFTFVTNRLPYQLSHILRLLINVMSLFFLIWACYYSTIITVKVWNTKLTATGLSNGIMYLALPVSLVSMIFHSINFIKDQAEE